MNIKQSTLAAAVTAALALGASQQAAAYVYAVSSLNIQDLAITHGGNLTFTGASFNFNLTNTAALNGVLTGTTATCTGSVGGTNTCGPAGLRLDALAANATGSAPVMRTNNDPQANNLMVYGSTPANLVGNWSNSDNVLYTAELLGDGTTSTNQIAESLLTGNGSASANSEIKSTTGLTYIFTVIGSGNGTLALSFRADPDMFAAIFGEPAGLYGAGANMNTSFTLNKDGGGGFANWNPQGTAANDCLAAGITCVEGRADALNPDGEDLNINVGTTTNNTSDPHSYAPGVLGLSTFGIQLGGLTAGTWTLTLNAVASTLVTRVPEPGMLALMGIGLLGLGMSARRKKLV